MGRWNGYGSSLAMVRGFLFVKKDEDNNPVKKRVENKMQLVKNSTTSFLVFINFFKVGFDSLYFPGFKMFNVFCS